MTNLENHPPLPEGFRLLHGERLVSVQAVTPRRMSGTPSSLEQMFRLTDARSEDEVGLRGPAVAALPLEASAKPPDSQNLYNALFGRDSLRVAIDLISYYPRLARSTLLTLARSQGTCFDTSREEEPGRIIHEDRDPESPIARHLTKTRGWQWPYYGSVDATPEFIRTLHAYCSSSDHHARFLFEEYLSRSGEPKLIYQALEAAVSWITTRMDDTAEGLVEFKSTLPKGIENQVWKDSWDAYHHADGSIANHSQGIASIEVQTVTHEALLDAASLYETWLRRPVAARELRERAASLARQILDIFWTEENGGYFVLGTDRSQTGKLRQLKVRTSNMGHVLNSRVIDGADPEHIHKRIRTLRQLQSPELLSVSGIRTLASDEVRYREGAYHNGSVWIWDTHHIAKGARRHGHNPEFKAFADELDKRILDVVNVVGGFPEYVRGGSVIDVNRHVIDVEDTLNHCINRVEQPPQEVQAWTVAAILATKRRRAQMGLL